MFHLKSVRLSAIDRERSAHFPFNVPVIRSLSGTEIEFLSEVTFFIGENGSGKSTFLEALACAARSITVGSESAEHMGRDRSVQFLAATQIYRAAALLQTSGYLAHNHRQQQPMRAGNGDGRSRAGGAVLGSRDHADHICADGEADRA
jgi:predicted ATPase